MAITSGVIDALIVRGVQYGWYDRPAISKAAAAMLAIPAVVSRGAGVVLLLFGAAVGYIATRDRLLRQRCTRSLP